MKIIQVKTGYLEENCYLLIKDNNCLVIDPGEDFSLIKEKIANFHVVGILITHNHFDHIGAKEEVLKHYHTKAYDKNNLQEGKYKIENFTFEVIYNPGHSEDSISFYFEKECSIFVGDFIFENSIGRCDLPTGNFNQMKESLNKFKNRFKGYKELNIYSGHGNKTTLDQELKYNIYFE